MTQSFGDSESRERNRDKFPIVFKNDSDETVPPFAIMQISSVDGVELGKAQLVHIIKPDGDGEAYMFNGPLAVRTGKKGRGRLTMPVVAKCNGTLAIGDVVGPAEDSWAVNNEGDGYKCLSSNPGNDEEGDPGFVLVASLGGGSGGALLKATAQINGRDSDDPTTSEAYEVIKGTMSGPIENWSQVDITEDSYMVALKIDGDNVIISAFC